MAIASIIHPTKLFSSVRWRTRITIWTFAAIAGVAAVGFTKLSDLALDAFSRLTDGRLWLTLLLTPSLGMFVVWATTRHFPGSQGSGIPQVIAATRALRKHEPVTRLLSLRIAVGKVFLGALALFAGFSAGREGPTVHISAIFMLIAHRWLPNQRVIRAPDLIIAGGAAGIAAAFNTPLAGIVFAIEEMSRSFEERTSGAVLTAIIVAGMASLAMLGNYTYFGHTNDSLGFSQGWIYVLICGVAGGIMGGIFSLTLLNANRMLPERVGNFMKENPIRFAAACGFVIALIGILSGSSTYGTGYSEAKHILEGTSSIPQDYGILKMLATIVSYLSGIPGGIFAPSLAVGAGFGSITPPAVRRCAQSDTGPAPAPAPRRRSRPWARTCAASRR